MNKVDCSAKKRVNFSLTEDSYARLKSMASRNGMNMSQMIMKLIWEEDSLSGPARINREWMKKLPTDTIDRLIQYSYENHTTPEQAISTWIWKQKVKDNVMPGQTNLFN